MDREWEVGEYDAGEINKLDTCYHCPFLNIMLCL